MLFKIGTENNDIVDIIKALFRRTHTASDIAGAFVRLNGITLNSKSP